MAGRHHIVTYFLLCSIFLFLMSLELEDSDSCFWCSLQTWRFGFRGRKILFGKLFQVIWISELLVLILSASMARFACRELVFETYFLTEEAGYLGYYKTEMLHIAQKGHNIIILRSIIWISDSFCIVLSTARPLSRYGLNIKFWSVGQENPVDINI